MRIFESLVLVALFLSQLGYCLPKAKRPSILVLPPLFAGAFAIASFLTEGGRWQMVPAYLLCVLFLILSVLQLIHVRPLNDSPRKKGSKPLRAIGLGFAWLGFALAAALPIILPVPVLPEPTGPFAIGVTDFEWIDSSRAEAYSTDPSKKRDLMVRAWYPAEKLRSQKNRGPYFDIRKLGPVLAKGMSLPSFIFDHMELAKGHSYFDAPLSPSQRTYPIILFSHGYDSMLSQNTVQMEELASRGYIVFSIAHPYESVILYPDGRIIGSSDKRIASPLSPEEERQRSRKIDALLGKVLAADRADIVRGAIDDIYALVPEQKAGLRVWSDDTEFAVSRIEAMNRGGPEGRFSGRLDLSRMGVFGHSYGGAAAGELCFLDPRFKAGINMDGVQHGDILGNSIKQPFMYMSGEGPAYGKINAEIYSRCAGPYLEVHIESARHFNYSDFSLLARFISVPGFTGSIDGYRMESMINGYIGGFFDEYVKGIDAPVRWKADSPSGEAKFTMRE
jgi:hypothetical protein